MKEFECIPAASWVPGGGGEDLCTPLSEAGSGVKWGSQAMNVTGRPHFSTPRTLEYSISAPLTNILQRAEGGVDFEVARVACFLRSGRRLDRCRQQMGEIGNQEQTIGDSRDDCRRTIRKPFTLKKPTSGDISEWCECVRVKSDVPRVQSRSH